MAQLGRLHVTVADAAGNAVNGASVEVRKQGATIVSGGAIIFVVNDPGGILAADNVAVNTGSTVRSVSSVTATGIIVGAPGHTGTSNNDRLTPTNNLPTLYLDAQGDQSTTNPVTTDSTGEVAVWAEIVPYDVHISGAGVTTELRQDEVPRGHGKVTDNTYDSATAVAYIRDTDRALSTAGAKHTSFRVNGTEKASIDKDGTGVFPRIGQTSTATTGGAIRIIDGNMFPLTVAGVQAALDEANAAGGGTVFVPSGANITLATTSIKIPNRVKLAGTGAYTITPTFTADAATNVTAMIENKDQDGTQQYAYIQDLHIDGNKASGATVTYGVYFKNIYAGSRITDILVNNCSGNGIVLDGTTNGLGQILMDNTNVANSNDDNIHFIRPGNVYCFQIASEGVAAGKAQFKITDQAVPLSAASSCILIGLKFEGTVAYDGLILDGVNNMLVDGIRDNGNGNANNLVKIIGTITGFDGAFAAGGHTIRNATANLTTIIDDTVAGVTIGNAQSRFVRWYSSPVSSTKDVSQIIGLQSARKGVAIPSNATIAPQDGNFFEITGTTNITTITADVAYSGKMITLQVTDVAPPDVIHGNNIVLRAAGNWNPARYDTLTLICDGTNWVQVAP